MCKAVEEVHRAGYVHRNLCPDHFLINAEGNIKLIGYAKAVEYMKNSVHIALQKVGISTSPV